MEYFQSIKMDQEISNHFIGLPYVPSSGFAFPSPYLCFRYPHGNDHPSRISFIEKNYLPSLRDDDDNEVDYDDNSNEDEQLQILYSKSESEEEENLQEIIASMNDKELPITTFSLMKDPVTFHLLIHRILSGFIEKTCSLNSSISLAKILNLSKLPTNFLTLLIEHPLRLSALIAQVRSGLWVYNGGNIITQIILYQKNHCCYDELYDFDILLLQTISILMGSFSF